MSRDVLKSSEDDIQINDDILNYLTKIKSQYLELKAQLQHKNEIIKELTSTNLTLSEKVEMLTGKLNAIEENSGDKKRRKTNSLEGYNNVDNSISFTSFEAPAIEPTKNHKLVDNDTPKSSKENILIQECASNFNDSIKIPTFKTPEKLNVDKRQIINRPVVKVLSPINKNSNEKKNINEISMNKLINLPRRIKSFCSPRNIENKKPEIKSGWLSKNNKSKTSWQLPGPEHQPSKLVDNLNSSEEVIACSQDLSYQTKSKCSRNLRIPKLRQAKLEFIDEPVDSKLANDETFCEDVVDESPTCTRSIFSKNSKKVLRTFRKIPKNKDNQLMVFPVRETVSAFELNKKPDNIMKPLFSTSTPASLDTNNMKKFKNEPITAAKNTLSIDGNATATNKESIEKNPKNIENCNEKSTNNKNLHDSSVFLIKSQPDDIIIIEDTDGFTQMGSGIFDEIANNDTETLFNAVIYNNSKKSPKELSPAIINTKITEPVETIEVDKNNPIDADADETMLTNEIVFTETLLDNLHRSIKSPTTVHLNNCDDCQKFKIYLINQNVPADEMKSRLQICKRVPKLDLTPDGFWDPCFQSWESNDPRNLTLVDYRYVNNTNRKNLECDKLNKNEKPNSQNV